MEKYWHPDDAKKKERRVVSEMGLMERCLSDNAYFAHEENVLLGMLLDLERPDFRMKAAKTRVKCTSISLLIIRQTKLGKHFVVLIS